MRSRFFLSFGLCVGLSTSGFTQLRVATYNITNYNGGLITELQTAFYSTFSGRQFAPDVIVCQEIISSTALNDLRTALNTAPGSPGDWQIASFVNGADTDSVFLYRSGMVSFLGQTVVSTGSSSTANHPRNIMRYDFRPVGYTSAASTIALYSTHMKAGDTTTDQSRRLIESQKVRDNAEVLPAGWNFIIGGDFNIPSSSESAYQELVGSQVINDGRFFDPINRAHNWRSSTYSVLHTQDPSGSGGMDDRYDQLLVSQSLIDNAGIDYIGNSAIPFNLSTWSDPNHSYRVWGNDGGSWNTTLRTTNNSMVGPTIAQALITLADNAGHLPVYCDFRLPAKITSPTVIDFGSVRQGFKPVSRFLTVGHAGNTALWTAAGLQNLQYSLTIPAGYSGPTGPFNLAPGAANNSHEIILDTKVPGFKNVSLTLQSNDPDQPTRVVTLRGYVIPLRGR